MRVVFEAGRRISLPLCFMLMCLVAGCGEQPQVSQEIQIGPGTPKVSVSAGTSFPASALLTPASTSAPPSPSGADAQGVVPATAVPAETAPPQADSPGPQNLPEESGGKGMALPKKYKAGEDPAFAQRKGWPVKGPEALPGAILPGKRILAYYGNPLSKRMGVLGQYPKEEMLERLRGEMKRWSAADPSLPVQPALHLIAVVAQGDPGKAGKYRMVMPDEIVNRVYGWAREFGALMFLDIQTGHEDIRSLLPRFEWMLKNPDVHLAIDPEFNLVAGKEVPGRKIGTYDAEDVNYASGFLRELVRKYDLPPKVLVVHRFTQNMLTNYRNVRLLPEVQIVMHMDGWGAPWLKRDSYRDYIVSEPVQYTGFKLFYFNDTKKGDPLLTPEEVLKLRPEPMYIQYQ